MARLVVRQGCAVLDRHVDRKLAKFSCTSTAPSSTVESAVGRAVESLRERTQEGPKLEDFLQSAKANMRASKNGVLETAKRGQAVPPTLPMEAMSELAAHLSKADVMKGRATRESVPSTQVSSMLTDSHGRFHNYLRISLTERCNLRCVYCMPESGIDLQPQTKMLTRDEIVRLATMFVHAGVDKIRLTGGEPLIRKDLRDIVASLSSLSGVRNVGITTNGINLSKKLPALKEAGLTHINVSLDTLRPDRFGAITRRKGLDAVLGSLEAALELGFGGRLKVNCVVMKGVNTDELSDFLTLTKNQELDIRFIEWMPFDDNRWNDNKFVSYQDMLDLIRVRYPDLERSSDSANDTTKWHRVPGNKGRVGFITSMSHNFCGTCNRLRITADGNLKVCLFGDESLSLRDAIRGGLSDVETSTLIKAAVLGKHAVLGGHGDMYGIAGAKNRPMTTIGG
ncbi:unnamed protein product [Discosporangium mesarthrocarpum]